MLRLDMLEHVDAADEIGALGRAVLGERRVGGSVLNPQPRLAKAVKQPTLARAVVVDGLPAVVADELDGDGREGEGRHAVLGVFVQALLFGAVRIRDHIANLMVVRYLSAEDTLAWLTKTLPSS